MARLSASPVVPGVRGSSRHVAENHSNARSPSAPVPSLASPQAQSGAVSCPQGSESPFGGGGPGGGPGGGTAPGGGTGGDGQGGGATGGYNPGGGDSGGGRGGSGIGGSGRGSGDNLMNADDLNYFRGVGQPPPPGLAGRPFDGCGTLGGMLDGNSASTRT